MSNCKSLGTNTYLSFPFARKQFFLTNSSLWVWHYQGPSFMQCLNANSLLCKVTKSCLLASPVGNGNSLKLLKQTNMLTAPVAFLVILVFVHLVFILGFILICPEFSFEGVGSRSRSNRWKEREERREENQMRRMMEGDKRSGKKEEKRRRKRRTRKRRKTYSSSISYFCSRQKLLFFYHIDKISAGALHYIEFISIVRPHPFSPLGLCSCLLGTA